MVFNAGFTGQVSTGKNILIAFSFDDPSSLPTMITHAYFYLCHYAMQATAISRIFTCIACNMFRINQLATAKDNLDFYATLFDLRHANTQRLSFKRSLRRVAKLWLADCEKAKQDLLGRSLSVLMPPRQTRSNVGFGVEGWCFPQTGQTPARKVGDWYKNDTSDTHLEAMVKQRRQSCPGLLLYRVGEDPDNAGTPNEKGKGGRGSCAQCKKPNSNVYCGLCHTWLCGPHVPLKKGSIEPNLIYCSLTNASESVSQLAPPTRLFAGSNDSNGVVFRNSCWHIWHKDGYQKRIDEFQTISPSSSQDF
jgi:hypothetical protein